jgi:hypothetical protein
MEEVWLGKAEDIWEAYLKDTPPQHRKDMTVMGCKSPWELAKLLSGEEISSSDQSDNNQDDDDSQSSS